jgi:hypothetical protein
MNKVLVKTQIYFSDYAPELFSYEIVTKEEWECLKEAMKNGLNVYIGELAGKHSEVEFSLENGDFEFVTDDENKIRQFEELFGSKFIGNFSLVDKVFETL